MLNSNIEHGAIETISSGFDDDYETVYREEEEPQW